jgi:hypothetical protein
LFGLSDDGSAVGGVVLVTIANLLDRSLVTIADLFLNGGLVSVADLLLDDGLLNVSVFTGKVTGVAIVYERFHAIVTVGLAVFKVVLVPKVTDIATFFATLSIARCACMIVLMGVNILMSVARGVLIFVRVALAGGAGTVG